MNCNARTNGPPYRFPIWRASCGFHRKKPRRLVHTCSEKPTLLNIRARSVSDIKVYQHINTKRVIQCQNRCELSYESKQTPPEMYAMVK